MPKFQRLCNNPFHENWSKHEGEKIVNLRARGLVAITTAFEQYVKEETGSKSFQGIKHLFTTCLNECFTKRRFTKLLSKGEIDQLKNKVQRQVGKTRQGCMFLLLLTLLNSKKCLWNAL